MQITIIADSQEKLDSPILQRSLAQVGLAGKASLKLASEPLRGGIAVVLGQQALNAVLGRQDQFIHDVNCYVFERNGTIIIPAFAPNQIFEQPDRHHWLNHALAKARNFVAKDADPTLHIEPSLMEVVAFAAKVLQAPQVSIDIECIRETCELTAIAFALPDESMSIPLAKEFMEHYWSEEEEAAIWKLIDELLGNPNAKVFQNAMFDCMILEHFGLHVVGPIEDTLWIANFLYPELPKGLKDLGRQYLYCEPWKTQKDFALTGDAKAFWRYNALDAIRTFQIYAAQQQEIDKRSLREFYDNYIKDLLNPALDTCNAGIAIDTDKYKSYNETIGALCEPIKESLRKIANPIIAPLAKRTRKRNKALDVKGPSPKTGKTIVLTRGYDEFVEPFNPASPAQLKLVLKALGYILPTHYGKETTDQTALLKLNRKRPHELITQYIQYKKLEKLQSSYLSAVFDNDDRCRFSYNRARDTDNNLGTKSGRFGCSPTPWGTGLSIHIIPRRDPRIPIVLKDIFIANPGETLVEVDLSQAELRVVAWLSGDPKLISQLERGEDIHAYMASEIRRTLHVDANRQFGKFVNHATAYGMGKFKFCDKALHDLEMVIDPILAQRVIDLRMQTYPMLRVWQQRTIEQVRRTRRLISPQGRERFFFGQFDDKMEREALSFIPQATVVDALNRSWIELSRLPGYNRDFRVLAQVHDSLLFSVKPSAKSQLLSAINLIFSQQKFTINGMERLIPHDISTGLAWGSMRKL